MLPKISLGLALLGSALFAGETAVPSTPAHERVGVFDSRAVAYAHFWQPAECAKRDTLIAAARAARAAGDRARFQELSRSLQESQARVHLQVFSTAPAAEAMTALAPRLPALAAELGVTRFISKWDEPALHELSPAAEQVEVTDRLVHEFIIPTEKHRKILDSIKSADPVPLAKAKDLLKSGSM